eukprot:TRINITY_DN9108_c0_g1_i1.p2 TRINITY_DN9108_c0_g1~~TRINITY_DN9108_c0_g1_i1.p2  ORF type:complete len:148 (+),score=51.58 TRINITY_DN9108_c0_g1_i1:59-502(+)
MPPKKGQAVEPEEPEEGSGTYVFEDGSKYEGAWIMHAVTEGGDKAIMRHGQGKMAENGNVYDGEWHYDTMQGNGAFRFENGSAYDGQWLQNKFEGKGAFTWPDGSAYEGCWRAGVMHGEGTYTDVEGRAWHGKFYNGTGPGLKLGCA